MSQRTSLPRACFAINPGIVEKIRPQPVNIVCKFKLVLRSESGILSNYLLPCEMLREERMSLVGDVGAVPGLIEKLLSAFRWYRNPFRKQAARVLSAFAAHRIS